MGLVVRTTHTTARHMRARSSATALGARTRAEGVRPNPYDDCTPYHHQSTQRGNAFTSVHSAHAKPQRFTAPLPGTQHPPVGGDVTHRTCSGALRPRATTRRAAARTRGPPLAPHARRRLHGAARPRRGWEGGSLISEHRRKSEMAKEGGWRSTPSTVTVAAGGGRTYPPLPN